MLPFCRDKYHFRISIEMKFLNLDPGILGITRPAKLNATSTAILPAFLCHLTDNIFLNPSITSFITRSFVYSVTRNVGERQRRKREANGNSSWCKTTRTSWCGCTTIKEKRKGERTRKVDHERKNGKTQTLGRGRLFTVVGGGVWRVRTGGGLLRLQITQDQRTIPRGTLSRSVPNGIYVPTSADRAATRQPTPSRRRVAIPPTVAPPRSSRRNIAGRGPRPE